MPTWELGTSGDRGTNLAVEGLDVVWNRRRHHGCTRMFSASAAYAKHCDKHPALLQASRRSFTGRERPSAQRACLNAKPQKVASVAVGMSGRNAARTNRKDLRTGDSGCRYSAAGAGAGTSTGQQARQVHARRFEIAARYEQEAAVAENPKALKQAAARRGASAICRCCCRRAADPPGTWASSLRCVTQMTRRRR
jgi:hypothetical protein